MPTLSQRDRSLDKKGAPATRKFPAGRTQRHNRRAGWRGLSVLALAMGAGFLALLVPGSAAQSSSAVYFRNFNGCNQLSAESSQITQALGTGWYRVQFTWNEIEPKKGTWNWQGPDTAFRQAQSQNAQVLPLLAYSALWAASRPGDVYSPPKNEADWEDFVQHVVSRYSSSPYNIRYYQVWNEPTMKAGFLHSGNPLDYIDQIYLPAAKVIRKNHCFVVFGGWPHSNSLEQFNQELEHNNAWQWTDIVDVHYFEMGAWPALYDHWVANGKCRGLWQTEIGWNTLPNFLPNTYWRILYWSLQQGWKDPDEFKVFWFNRLSLGADGPKSLITGDGHGHESLTAHGQRLAVMNELLNDGPLSLFTSFSSSPSFAPTYIEVNPTVLGLRVGSNRVVIAMLLPASVAGHSVNISVNLPQKPAQVQLLSATGESLAVRSGYSAGHLQVSASTSGFSTAVAAIRPTGPVTYSIGYLKIDM